MDTNASPLRTEVDHVSSFVSIPEAFPGLERGLQFVAKIALNVGRFDDAKHPLKFDIAMDPHLLLIDLEAFDPDDIDFGRVIRDCELIAKAVQSSPTKLKDILGAFGSDVSHDRILDAAKTVEELGLTEEATAEAGGGIAHVLVLLAVLALASCKGCAHTQGSTRQQ